MIHKSWTFHIKKYDIETKIPVLIHFLPLLSYTLLRAAKWKRSKKTEKVKIFTQRSFHEYIRLKSRHNFKKNLL